MIKPDNLLSTAKEFSLDENEVILRESIKLSYYYVYHTVYLLLNEKNINCNDQKMGSHEQLIVRVKSINDKEGRKLGDILRRLRNRRVNACYSLDKNNFTKQLASQHILECEKYIERFSNLIK